jgi:hypothetical protein
MQEVMADLRGRELGCSRYLRSSGTSWRRSSCTPGPAARAGQGKAGWGKCGRQGRQGCRAGHSVPCSSRGNKAQHGAQCRGQG